MRLCPDCGTQFDSTLSACPKCGCPSRSCREVDEHPSTPHNPQPNYTPLQSNDDPENTILKLAVIISKFWIVVGWVLLLWGVVLIFQGIKLATYIGFAGLIGVLGGILAGGVGFFLSRIFAKLTVAGAKYAVKLMSTLERIEQNTK